MSTEFNPMEGLLADLLSTWDEEPASVPEDELSVPRPVMVQAPDMVAEVKDPVAAPPPMFAGIFAGIFAGTSAGDDAGSIRFCSYEACSS